MAELANMTILHFVVYGTKYLQKLKKKYSVYMRNMCQTVNK